MAVPNLPTFANKEKLTSGKLNQFSNAIDAKFSALTGADITWPLIMGGDLDADSQHFIVNLRTFWSFHNAAEYATLQLAIDAAVTAGGGCVLIPPVTTLTADNLSIGASNVWIVGCGTSSIIQLTSNTSNAHMFQTGTNLSNIGFANVTLDGQNTGTGSPIGINVRRIAGFRLIGCVVKNFKGDGVVLTHDGTTGQGCTDSYILNSEFSGGSADHISGIDISGLQIRGILSKSASASTIHLEAADATAKMQDIEVGYVRSESAGGIAINILGAGATLDTDHSRINVHDCSVVGATSDHYNIGEASKILGHVSICNNVAHDSLADAFVINADEGIVSGNSGYSATGDGIDLVDSKNLTVSNNSIPDATLVGIDADGTANCVIINNNVQGAGTEGVKKDSAAPLNVHGNIGDPDLTADTVIASNTSVTSVTGTSPITVLTYTIPANTISKAGDGLRIVVSSAAGGAGNLTTTVEVDANQVGTGVIVLNEIGILVVEGYIAATSGAGNFRSNSRGWDRLSAQDAAINNDTIDFTTDIVITIKGTNASAQTSTIHDVRIEFLGGIIETAP